RAARALRVAGCDSGKISVEPPGAADLATHPLDVFDLSLDESDLERFARVVFEAAEDQGHSEVWQLPAGDASALHAGLKSNGVARRGRAVTPRRYGLVLEAARGRAGSFSLEPVNFSRGRGRRRRLRRTARGRPDRGRRALPDATAPPRRSDGDRHARLPR